MEDHPQPTQWSAPPTEQNEGPTPVLPDPIKPKRPKWLIVLIVFLVLIIAVLIALLLRNSKAEAPDKSTTSTKQTTKTTEKKPAETVTVLNDEGLKLDESTDYGDKYADGIVPVGDNKYSTSTPSKGNIYVCRANFVPAGQAGAQTRGPWFTNNNTEYDLNKKASIAGSVAWKHSFTQSVLNGKRSLVTNSLPNHVTGVFPVAASDPARKYDANPGTIQEQNLTYSLTSEPTYGAPQCVDGEVGIMLTGIAIYNGFDAGGRDAGAWEVQDSCDGHPQNKGMYHYHTFSSCIDDTSVQTVVGWALDGFPITGPKVGDTNILTTDDLDECHGITSTYVLDGKKVSGFHYVMTQDFPYSVSCYRGTPVTPPGRPER